MTLEEFLENWDAQNRAFHKQIPLFNPELSKNLSKEQQRYFARVFYHLRGHFHDFLWYMGNHAPDTESKKVILDNIAEEFGSNGRSHERLYLDFAACLGVDLTDEVIHQKTYLPFAREFNKKHLEWLASNDWQSQLATFTAYERLDNVDYNDLLDLVKSFDVTENGLLFFKAHSRVNHYEMARDGFQLRKLWSKNPQKIKEAYTFIRNHQNKMWKDLSDAVFNYN